LKRTFGILWIGKIRALGDNGKAKKRAEAIRTDPD